MKISPAKFAQLMEEGLALIPAEFHRHIADVAIVIEEQPDRSLCQKLGLSDHQSLYGLQTGIPLTERAINGEPLFPDRIVIYRQPLLAHYDDPDVIRREVARTVIHEIAHHFGIDEDRLAELGWD